MKVLVHQDCLPSFYRTHLVGSFFLLIKKKFFFFLFLACHPACGILVPPPGMEPMPLGLRAWSLTLWTTQEVGNFCHIALSDSCCCSLPVPVFGEDSSSAHM